MKLAILTQYYPPEIGAPQARLAALAQCFVRRGHDVTVLTAMPSYPRGRIYPGYGGFLREETLDGARILRTAVYPTQSADTARRLANYLSFTFSAACVGTVRLGRPDMILVESPPLFLGLTGAWLSRLTGARLVFNVSDLWPASAVHLGRLRAGSTAHRLSAWLERFCYRRADLVTGQSREIVDDIARRHPECGTYHLSNGVDTETFGPERTSPRARALLSTNGRCVAVYAGLHGIAQGLDLVIEAGAHLPAGSPVDLVFVGDGPERERLVATARERGARVRFLDPRPHAEMPSLLASADIVIVPLVTHLPGAVPSKLYEAMASARPVILVAEGEAARIVQQHGAGLVVRPGDAAGLRRALLDLADDPVLRARLGANGRAAAVQRYDRKRIGNAFVDLLEQRYRPPSN